jgi:hypothetical protein
MYNFIMVGQERSEMVLCSICPDPGRCCQNFDSTELSFLVLRKFARSTGF